MSFVISRTSLNRGSLNRGSTVFANSFYIVLNFCDYICKWLDL